MAEQSNDRLFDTGCALCGGQSAGKVLIDGESQHFCSHHGTEISFTAFRAEVLRRKSPPAPSQAERIPEDVATQWEPRAGEECVGTIHPNSNASSRGEFTGRFIGYASVEDSRAHVAGAPLLEAGRYTRAVTRESLRPLVSTPPVRDEKTPATDAADLQAPNATSGVAPAAENTGQPTDPYVEHRARLLRDFGVNEITVEMSAKESEKVTRCPMCGGPNYARWDDRCPCCGVTGKAIRAGVQPTDLDRLAARRMRSSRAEIEGGRAKWAERHPSDWDPEDADSELRVS